MSSPCLSLPLAGFLSNFLLAIWVDNSVSQGCLVRVGCFAAPLPRVYEMPATPQFRPQRCVQMLPSVPGCRLPDREPGLWRGEASWSPWADMGAAGVSFRVTASPPTGWGTSDGPLAPSPVKRGSSYSHHNTLVEPQGDHNETVFGIQVFFGRKASSPSEWGPRGQDFASFTTESQDSREPGGPLGIAPRMRE